MQHIQSIIMDKPLLERNQKDTKARLRPTCLCLECLNCHGLSLEAFAPGCSGSDSTGCRGRLLGAGGGEGN